MNSMEIMEKYRLGAEENRAFLGEMREELLRFGRRFPSPQGSAYYLGDDGAPWKDRPRETWITCRMAHVYGIGAMLGFPGSEALADAALRGLTGELRDRAHGGWFAGVRADGSPLPDKQAYAHAFVMLAASTALLAGRPGARALLSEALRLFDARFWDEAEGLSIDAWDTDFTRPADYRGVNANMHTVEAFLAVADATGDETYRERAGRVVRRVLGWAEENGWRVPEHFSAGWTPLPEFNREKPDDPFKPYGATPGHGVEWARLTAQWAVSAYGRGSARAQPYIAAARTLYRRAVDDGWACDGAPGFVYTTDWRGAPVVRDRMHWTLAEAINTSAVLWRLTGDARCAEDYARFMAYLDGTVRDRENGSWFHQLDENNRPKGTVWPGKSDLYHALQATIIPYAEDPGVSVASAVRRAAEDARPWENPKP